MTRAATAANKAKTPILASSAGLPALLFRSDMDVNTDGTARSYHPDDPRGKIKAFNNVGNAITGIYDTRGRSIDCSPRQGACFARYMAVFEESRDAGWSREGHRWFTSDGIIPWKTEAGGRRVPCTIADGPFKGYFISQTSRKIDPSRGDCDQAAYIDAFALNAIVLPKGARWASQGVATDEFDLVAVRNRATGAIRYAIIGDKGPRTGLGEGSIALAAALGGRTVAPDATYQQIKGLKIADVDYLIFPTVDAVRKEPGPVTPEKIDRLGRNAFEQWGGVARLDACSKR